MINIYKVFFCDSVLPGQFGKINLNGLIPTRSVSLSSVPYNWITNIVILGEGNEIPENFILQIQYYNKQGQKLNLQQLPLSEEFERTVEDNPPYQIFLIVQYQIRVDSLCDFILSLLRESKVIYEEKFFFEIGESPNISVSKHLPYSQVFSGKNEEEITYVKDILSSASKNLKIFDDYIDPNNLYQNLLNVDKNLKVEVLTLPKHQKLLRNFLLLKNFSNLQIRFSDEIHDRFIVINDSEYYHFGHSLKDLNNKKLSRASKVINRDEIKVLSESFYNIWGKAKL